MKKNSLLKAILVVFFVYVFLSWIIPIGYFNNGVFIKEAVAPVGLFDVILYPLVMTTTSVFILTALLFLTIGGFYGVLNQTGAYSTILEKIKKKSKGKEKIVLISIILFFTILSSLTGLTYPLFILVPFASAIVMILGYNKLVTMLSTVGSILIGNIASTYGFNVAGYVSYLTENIHDSIWVRVILLVLVTIALIFITLKIAKTGNNKEEIPLYEKKISKETNIFPFIVMFIFTILIILIGMFNWSGTFNIELFNDIYENITNFKIGSYHLFANIIGSFRAIGTWTNYEVCFVLIVNAFIIGRLYKLKWKDIIDSFIEGMKKMLPVALWIVIASIIFLLMNTNQYTFYNTIVDYLLNLTKKLNILTFTATSVIGSILYNDFPYFLSTLYSPITTLYTNFPLIGIMTQMIHGFVQIIAPTSIILVAGLTYFEISYKDWLKKLWELFLWLIAAIVITIIIMLVIV